MDYRTASPPPPEKKKEEKRKMSDETKAILTVVTIVAVLIFSLFYSLWHDESARAMHREHDQYVRRQEICIAHGGWYVHEENYHGLISCHRLDNHEQFYVVPETGLALTVVND